MFGLSGLFSGTGHTCCLRRAGLPVLFVLLTALVPSGKAWAQVNDNHVMLSVGALYARGFDATLSYEHGSRYHNAWEYFAGYYIQYRDDAAAGHVTRESFWHSYNSWHVGIAYKPCVSRGRNHHGNARLGVSGGSDLNEFLGGIHVGYEHSYALRGGFEVFFQVREDVVIRGDDLFRTGLSVGVKCPI